jgi:pyruvate dehydrogenase E1 component beta subunit
MRPIIEFMTWNFSLVAYDQIVNSAAKIYQMSGGQYKVPIVFRGPNGAAENLASQHSTSVESLYAHFPGLKVVTYATAYDAKGLLKSAIRDDSPVCFLESEMTYGMKGEVPDEEYLIPIGKADIKAEGSDVTWSPGASRSSPARPPPRRSSPKASPRSSSTCARSAPWIVRPCSTPSPRPAAAVVVQEGHPFAGVGAEIVAQPPRALLRRA